MCKIWDVHVSNNHFYEGRGGGYEIIVQPIFITLILSIYIYIYISSYIKYNLLFQIIAYLIL